MECKRKGGPILAHMLHYCSLLCFYFLGIIILLYNFRGKKIKLATAKLKRLNPSIIHYIYWDLWSNFQMALFSSRFFIFWSILGKRWKRRGEDLCFTLRSVFHFFFFLSKIPSITSIFSLRPPSMPISKISGQLKISSSMAIFSN